MNYITQFILLLAILLTNACKNNDLIKNKPKEIIEYFVIEESGKYKKGALYSRIKFTYDQKGNRIEENYYDGNKLNKTYKYDEKAHIIETKKRIGETKLFLIYEYTNKYNEKGRLIAWKVNLEDEPTADTIATYKYDENNNITEQLYYVDRYVENLLTTFIYDRKGNKIEVNEYSNKKLVTRKLYKYDDQGNEIEESTFNLDGILLNRFVYRYDDRGKKIEYNAFNSIEANATPIRTEKYHYDENNNLMEEIIIAKPNYFKTIYKYDNRRNLIDAKTYNFDGSINQIVLKKVPMIVDTIYFK